MSSEDMTSLLNAPAGIPPPGITAQLDDPPNERITSNVLPILSIVLATLLVAMRIYTSAFITRRMGIADYSLLIFLALFIPFSILLLLASNIAPHLHIWDMRVGDLLSYFYYGRFTTCLYGPTIFFIKLSILVQYIQVFMPNKRPRYLYWATILIIGFNFCAYTIILGLRIWSCNPMRKTWDFLVTDGYCLDTRAVAVSTSAVNVISDTFIFLLPQAVIWRLNMTTKQKVAVSLLFFIAILAIVSASIRAYYTVRLTQTTDDTWILWMMGMWTLGEMTFGIMVACLPAAGAFCRNLSQSSLFSALSNSFRGIIMWRKISPRQETADYGLEDGEYNTDPSLGSKEKPETTRVVSWVRSYGVAGLDTLTSVNEPQTDQNAALRQSV